MSATSASTSMTTRPVAHLRCEAVSKSFGDRRVLTDVSFTVAAGEPAGLIGENGSGKSTLLRIAAGLTRPDAGTVTAKAPALEAPRIGILHQVPPFSEQMTVAEALEAAVAPAHRAAAAVADTATALAVNPEEPAVVAAYQDALAEAERCEAWATDARIDTMLAGLGIADLPRHRLVTEMSGGQRARLSLAWLLLNTPDVLLLDEPTNHLDEAAVDHLCRVITRWRGPVLTASHDRAFLNDVVRSLIDLDPSVTPRAVTTSHSLDDPGSGVGVTRFRGTYRDYVAYRRRARDRWEQQYHDEQAELSRLQAAVVANHGIGDSSRAPRTEARSALKFYSDRNAKVVSHRVRSSRAQLEKLQKHQIRKPPRHLSFRGWAVADEHAGAHHRSPAAGGTVPTSAGAGARPTSLHEVLLSATEVAVQGRLGPVSLTVRSGERWLVTGPNGAGKTTLLAVLDQRVPPTSGSITRAPAVRTGLLAQDDDLAGLGGRGPGLTVFGSYVDRVGRERAELVPLSTFGLFHGRDEGRPVATLSVGQQRRLALAVLLADPPEVLLLDEPTNHLSLALVTELEGGINAYPGAVVIASHDRWLRDSWEGNRLPLGAHDMPHQMPELTDRPGQTGPGATSPGEHR